jgi:hypothetical protein
MKYFYNQLFANKCEIHVLPTGEHVYTIFKNGSSAVVEYSDKVYINQQIPKLGTLTVYWREAEQRFRVGVSTYIENNEDLDTTTLLDLINNGQLVDPHFVSQYIWLQNLRRYSANHIIKIKDYKTIPVDEVWNSSMFIPRHEVEIPSGWCELDNLIFEKFIDQETSFDEIDEYVKAKNRMLYNRCIALA